MRGHVRHLTVVAALLAVLLVGAAGPLTDSADAAAPVTVAVGDALVPEGNVGRTPALVAVRVSDPVATDTLVTYTTSGGSATAGVDFIARTGTARIRAGKTTATVTVPVLADAVPEADESVVVTLTGAGGMAIADSTGAVTIRDDEAAIGVSIGNAAIPEGDSGLAPVKLRVTLDQPLAADTFVDYTTIDDQAVAPVDYKTKGGRVRIRAGKTVSTITVPTYGDVGAEGDESFVVQLTGTGTSGVPIAAATGTVMILDDDTPSIPEAPTDLAVVAGPMARWLTATWSAPTSPTPVIGYDIEVTRIGITNVIADVTSPYSFGCGLASVTDTCITRVRAHNTSGPGPWSAPVTASTWAPPAAPLDLQLSGGGGAIAWAESPSDRPIVHYEIHESMNGGSNWTFVDTTTNLAILTPCGECQVRVRATSTVGVGAWATMAIARPGSPTGLVAERDASDPNLVHLSWTAPLDPGSHPITGYEVLVGGGAPSQIVPTTELDLFLRPTLTWSVQVYAINAAGRSVVPATVVLPPSP